MQFDKLLKLIVAHVHLYRYLDVHFIGSLFNIYWIPEGSWMFFLYAVLRGLLGSVDEDRILGSRRRVVAAS